MFFQRQSRGTIFLAAWVSLLAGCEKTPLPPPTATSAAPSAAPSAPVAFVLDPQLLADRPDEYTAPRRVLARIQSNLERVAARKEPVGVPKEVKADGLEAFVLAYHAVLDGNAGAADALEKIGAFAIGRLETKIQSAKKERGTDSSSVPVGHEIENYVKLVSESAKAPIKDPEDLVTRLVATMRLVDAALLMESGHYVYDDSYDLFEREDHTLLRPIDHFRDGAWIRLPCSMISSHRKALEAADKRLGKASGPLLSCPVPEKRQHDYEFMERGAKSPAEWASAFVREPLKTQKNAPSPNALTTSATPSPPWNWDQAIEYMNEDPDAAEKALTAAAAKNIVGKLDYALFLQAFRPSSKTRDEKIKKLVAEVDKASAAALKKSGDEFLTRDGSIDRRDYDGTEESLIGSIRLASSSGSANTTSAFYAIPCAILMARPKLLEATEPLFGGNRDNFLPRAGCSWGRGGVKGFPNQELTVWRNATEEADGYFLENFSGTMRFGLASNMNLEEETLRTNPQKLLQEEAPKMQWPYETWSYMTPEGRTIYKKLLGLAEPLQSKLFAHYKARRIAEKDAERIAHAALFQAVWGADCGKAAPGRTLRKLVVDGAPESEIRAFVAAKEYEDEKRLEPFRACAKLTGTDPLIHLAVLAPHLLPVLWELFPKPMERAKDLDVEVDPNMPNLFGKTPLMVAAQQNQLQAAKLLLDHGAAIDRTTFKKVPPSEEPELAHDARTALMYAAARGSFDMIRLLLDRGADKYAADTKGRRPVHYLLGLGPVAANPKLSAAEVSEAVKLLY
ncbi:MAG TPA: ankyrin repeat domain-containing protein [Polyangium sp.]|nr:ankyrin repeat domain-containing protein [Polyangium sp.]